MQRDTGGKRSRFHAETGAEMTQGAERSTVKGCMKKSLKSLPMVATKAFGIALMLCGSMQKIVASTAPQTVKEIPAAITGQFFSRPEVIFSAGVIVTIIGFLLKSDRDSMRTTIHNNHTELKEWMGEISKKTHFTAEELAALKGACEARRKQGEC